VANGPRQHDPDDDGGVEEHTQPVRAFDPTAARAGFARGREAPAGRVRVSADGPFTAAAVTWRDAGGRLFCTLVAKASYELAPGMCPPLPEPVAIQAEDQHGDEDPQRSVVVPSDLAPFKAAAEVVVVGSAFAPGGLPAQSVNLRVAVGSVDKTVAAWAPRRRRADGTIEELPRQVRFSLRHEHAAGGPDTDNPAGIDPRRADARGRRALPELLPVGFELKRPDQVIPTVGLGPLGAGWRPRMGYLGDQDEAWLRGPREAPLPPGFPPRFFQAAPMDQWLDRPIAANERLVLEGLHDSIPRLVTSLAGIEPWAVLGASDEPLRLSGDLLYIDTDRCLLTLTFRAQVPLDEQAGPIEALLVGMPMGAPPSAEAVRRAHAAGKAPEIWAESTTDEPDQGQRRALPFGEAAGPPVVAPPAFVPPAFVAPPSALAMPPLRMDAAPPLRMDAAPPLRMDAAPPLRMDAAPPLRQGTDAPAPPAVVSASAALGGLRAASDAAAEREQAASRSAAGAPRTPPAAPPPRRLAVVDLLFFEPPVAPRLRAQKRHAPMWTAAPRPRVASVDEPRREPADRDRDTVLRVLCFARPDGAASIRRALADALDEGDLEPPLGLVAGELRPHFDETETLRATIAAAQPVAGNDRKVLAALALANEALATSIGPRPDAALSLARQIEAATGGLSLPPRYVGSQAERALLEGRKHKHRTLRGAPRLRADLALRDGEALPVYLPEAVAGSLPLLPSFPVIMVCEVRPREDAAEAQAEALFAVALGRVLHVRAPG
jgi:hypothetical protein